jgi:gliding motility-associated-like protein
VYGPFLWAQNNYGDPVLKQVFGEGNSNPNTIGPPLRGGVTDFIYSSDLCPPPGSYTLARRINLDNCFNYEWIPLGGNHTPYDDFGMMMIVNNNETTNNKIVYVDTITKSLCPGTTYRYSFAVINIDSVSTCPFTYFPVFELRLEDDDGRLIKNDTTSPINYAVFSFGYHFKEFGFDFIMPGGVNKLVAKILLLPSKHACAEDFAVDDILIVPEGPRVNIVFTNERPETIVKSVCFQQNETISMSGDMGAYYTNPALQWQLSKDSGLTWTDISGATANVYSRSFPTPDTFYFRLTGAEVNKIANPNCRVTSNFIRVQVNDIPLNFDAASNSPVCSGQDLMLHAEGGATYMWTGPNGFYDNTPSPHIFFSSLADSGMYHAEITTLGGCKAYDSTYVSMIGTDVHAGPDTLICSGDAVQLYASAGTRYEWSPQAGLSNAVIKNPKAAPAVTTTYTVKVTSADGCSDTAKVIIKVLNNAPVKAIFSNPEYICRPTDTASFTDLSMGKIVKWLWNFGNGQTSILQHPPLQFYSVSNATQNYVASLKVIDTTGCTDSVLHLIKVAGNCYIAVPAAFTPNMDGVNDYLYPLNAYKATNLLFRVFDRVGHIVFETKDWTRKWDGTYKNFPQPAGVYIWMLDYNDASNKRVSLRGTTVLLR